MIGVAIDEGIAKEIHESFVASGGDFSGIIKAETARWLTSACPLSEKTLGLLCGMTQTLTLRVYHFGVETTSGEGDLI